MEHEALVHTVAMLVCAFLGLMLGSVFDILIPDWLIDVALAAMLYFVFVCIDAKAFKEAFRDFRFTSVTLAVNFVWTPLFAFALGYLFFSGEIDVRIGLLLALAAPCTDWYLVFTAAAKGNVSLSSAILPMNLVLQILLVPVYLMLFFGSEIHMGSSEPILLAVATLVVPLLVATMVRAASKKSGWMEKTVVFSQTNASSGQIIFLCAAVFIMFFSCSHSILDNWVVLVGCVIPLLAFFLVNTLLTLSLSRGMRWDSARSSSLMFTSLARNSPLILAMMSPVFSDEPLVLAVLVVCPLVELPFLSLASYIRGRRN